MRIVKWVLVGVVAAIVLAVAAFTIWAYTPLGPMPEALAALTSDDQVQVETDPWLTFRPTGSQPDTGFIFYPGGRVDYRAYAPAARQIAARGYLVVIVPMPLNLAVFNPGAASAVIAANPQIQRWAIGGHSLGGAMAANFAKTHLGAVQALVLWASYPAASDDLSASPLKVASISGSLDGLSTIEKVNASRPLLPTSTTWVQIAGGNHAQFGWYGDQAGDNPASISRESQQEQVVIASVRLLETLK